MIKSAISRQNLSIGTGTGSRYGYPWTEANGTGTHSQKRVGIGIDQSGIGTDASDSPDFYTLALLSLIFVHR